MGQSQHRVIGRLVQEWGRLLSWMIYASIVPHHSIQQNRLGRGFSRCGKSPLRVDAGNLCNSRLETSILCGGSSIDMLHGNQRPAAQEFKSLRLPFKKEVHGEADLGNRQPSNSFGSSIGSSDSSLRIQSRAATRGSSHFRGEDGERLLIHFCAYVLPDGLASRLVHQTLHPQPLSIHPRATVCGSPGCATSPRKDSAAEQRYHRLVSYNSCSSW